MSNLKVWILLSILWISFEAAAQSQAFDFTHLTTKEGLSNSSVKCIIQDHQGFMWFGTANGLNRYDGYTFKIYKHQPGDSSTLTDNVINTVYEDRDSLLWVGTDIGLHLFDRSKDEFIRIPGPLMNGKPGSRIISAMLEDQSGNFWIGTDGGGLYHFDRQESIFTPFKKPGVYHGQNTILRLFEDSKHRLWIGTLAGLFHFDTEKKELTHFSNRKLPSDVLHREYVSDITETVNGDLLIATLGHGLYSFDPDKGIYTHLSDIFAEEIQQSSEKNIFALTCTKNGQIWIGTGSKGIQVWNFKQKDLYTCKNDPFNPQSISGNQIQTIYEDPLGDLWIGTQSQGISFWSPRKKAFKPVRYFPHLKNGLSHPQVTSFFENESGEIWLGTLGGGLNRFDPHTGFFSHYRHQTDNKHSLGNDLVLSVIEDNEAKVWVVNSKWGVSCFDPVGDIPSFQHHRVRLPRSLFQDTKNRIWLGAGFGITLFDPVSKRFRPCQDPPGAGEVTLTSVVSIYEDLNQTVWFGSYEGLFYYDEALEKFIHFPLSDTSLRDNIETPVTVITGDKEGNLWVGGNLGLVRIQLSNGEISAWRIHDGLPDDMVSNITIDMTGRVWISTAHGLSVLDQMTGDIRNYDRVHDLDNHEFNPRASIVTKSGHLYFGGTNGFHVFHPDSIYDNTLAPPVHITNLYLHDRISPMSSNRGYASFSRDYQIPKFKPKDRLYLKPWQNSLTFEFAALNYLDSEKNLYKYRLEGFQDDWLLTSSDRRFASFPKLPPGTYTFSVRGSNNDQYWNETGDWLRIHIAAPWYWSWWSKSLYLIALLAVIYSNYQYQLRKKLVQAELFRLQELDALKTRMFTNISHEFRTPLTVITGTAEEEIEKNGKLSPAKNLSNARLIRRNSDQMLNLVDQMLSLRKLDSRNTRVKYINADILPFLRYLVESFYSVAEVKKIGLEMRTSTDEIFMDYDPNQLKTIVTNLLTNALKFTHEGQVILFVDTVESPHDVLKDVSSPQGVSDNTPVLRIRVRDTGIGIKAEALPHIFDRFYQAENGQTSQGTGIGLALTKELIKLLRGHISIKSREGEGTEATIILPITHQAPGKKEVQSATAVQTGLNRSYLTQPEMKESVSHGRRSSAELPLLLIIEDNADVLRYLQSCLKDDYDLIFAKDGKDGIEQAFDAIPQIIISDVMMPTVDGFEVCQTLKEDIRTSHIPIILLTAKADMSSKLTGLRGGADDYLTKPFDKKELLIRLQNLLQQRKRLQQYYLSLATGAKIESASQKRNDQEDLFICQLRSIIEAHLDDPAFSVSNLCHEVGISHAQLHRKTTALIGHSTNHLIRSIRLSKAKELLKESTMNISEIAYETGFSDPAYFTRVFRKEFGITPSRYKKAIVEEVGK